MKDSKKTRGRRTGITRRDAAVAAVILLVVVPAFVLGVSSASGANVQQYTLPNLGKKDVKIMVLGYSGSFVTNDVMLKIMPRDAECDLFRLDEVKALNLAKYDIILVLSHVFDFEGTPDQLSISKIRNYVSDGGCLISLLQFSYDWLNLSLGFDRRLVTSLAMGNLSDPFYQELQWSLSGNLLSVSEVASQIEALKASAVHDEGFFYPAYGVFSNYSGSSLIIDSVSQEPVLVRTHVGLGTVIVSTCAWDYHLSRSDIPQQTVGSENLLFYHVMLYGVRDKQPTGMPTMLIVGAAAAIVVLICALVMLRRRGKGEALSRWSIFFAIVTIMVVAALGSILLDFLHSDVEKYYTKLYQIDRDLDGFPDQGTSIMQLDDVFLSLERGKTAIFWYTGVLWITIIASVFAAVVTLLTSGPLGSDVSPFRWAPLWKRLVLFVAFTLLMLLAALAVFGSSLA